MIYRVEGNYLENNLNQGIVQLSSQCPEITINEIHVEEWLRLRQLSRSQRRCDRDMRPESDRGYQSRSVLRHWPHIQHHQSSTIHCLLGKLFQGKSYKLYIPLSKVTDSTIHMTSGYRNPLNPYFKYKKSSWIIIFHQPLFLKVKWH